ncbi:MAG: hypothetical protein ACREE4_12280 [Stellaceae bacterium]
MARGFAGLAAQLASWTDRFAQVLRNRRDARMLASFDQTMLADIGLRQSDINDAFSVPFWQDPTPLLRERAQERRLYRHVEPPVVRQRPVEPNIRRLNIKCATRHAV